MIQTWSTNEVEVAHSGRIRLVHYRNSFVKTTVKHLRNIQSLNLKLRQKMFITEILRQAAETE